MDTDIVAVQLLDDVEAPPKAVRVLMVVGSVFVERVVAVLDTGKHKSVKEDEDSVILD